jgi:hypothetical protein
MTVEEVAKRTAALCDDPQQDWCDLNYVIPILTQIHDEVYDDLKAINAPLTDEIAVLSPVVAGAVDLSSFAAKGKPLENMLQPRWLDWKLVGDLDTAYLPIERVDKLADIDPGTRQGVSEYRFRGSTVYITPSSVDVTIRIEFEQLWLDFQDGESAVEVSSLGHILARRTAAEIMGGARGNEKAGTWHLTAYQKSLDQLLGNYVRTNQRTVRRVGRSFGRRRSLAGRWPRFKNS